MTANLVGRSESGFKCHYGSAIGRSFNSIQCFGKFLRVLFILYLTLSNAPRSVFLLTKWLKVSKNLLCKSSKLLILLPGRLIYQFIASLSKVLLNILHHVQVFSISYVLHAGFKFMNVVHRMWKPKQILCITGGEPKIPLLCYLDRGVSSTFLSPVFAFELGGFLFLISQIKLDTCS